MPRHRSLTLKKLVAAIDPELIERYFTEKLPKKATLPQRFIMSPKAVEIFMNDPRNLEAKGLVLQDFRKINDICEKGKNLIVRAYNYSNIQWNTNHAPENLAMKLFIDHRKAFDYAYAWFCYYHASAKMSHHRMPGDFNLTKKKKDSFLKEIKGWFTDLAKGQECIVTPYDEDNSTVILIKHGSYVRTVAYWNKKKIEFLSFRPANEDILIYDKDKEILSIKATLPKDREQYIESFARCIMNDESLAEDESRDTVYTLEPIQNGSFDWNGNETIKRIYLTEVIIEHSGGTGAVVKIRSNDVRKTLAQDISCISLDSGKLTYVRLRFVLGIDGKEEKVAFMISPPSVSDLTQKKHVEIISDYLKEQGVKLI